MDREIIIRREDDPKLTEKEREDESRDRMLTAIGVIGFMMTVVQFLNTELKTK